MLKLRSQSAIARMTPPNDSWRREHGGWVAVMGDDNPPSALSLRRSPLSVSRFAASQSIIVNLAIHFFVQRHRSLVAGYDTTWK